MLTAHCSAAHKSVMPSGGARLGSEIRRLLAGFTSCAGHQLADATSGRAARRCRRLGPGAKEPFPLRLWCTPQWGDKPMLHLTLAQLGGDVPDVPVSGLMRHLNFTAPPSKLYFAWMSRIAPRHRLNRQHMTEQRSNNVRAWRLIWAGTAPPYSHASSPLAPVDVSQTATLQEIGAGESQTPGPSLRRRPPGAGTTGTLSGLGWVLQDIGMHSDYDAQGVIHRPRGSVKAPRHRRPPHRWPRQRLVCRESPLDVGHVGLLLMAVVLRLGVSGQQVGWRFRQTETGRRCGRTAAAAPSVMAERLVRYVLLGRVGSAGGV